MATVNRKFVNTATGFKLVTEEAVHRLILSIEGTEGCGKNHFAFTAPGPLAFHSFDFGDDGVVQKFMRTKKIHRAEYRLNIPAGTAVQEASESARPVWKTFIDNFAQGLQSQRSTIIDTGTDAYEVLRMVEHGKLTQVLPHHYGPVNQAMKSLWRQGYDSGSNLIFLHRMKESWATKTVNGKEVSNKTGEWEMSGYGGTYFEAQVCLRNFKDNGEFKSLIFKCRQNPTLEGMVLEGDMCNFPTLGQLVFPDSDEKEWI